MLGKDICFKWYKLRTQSLPSLYLPSWFVTDTKTKQRYYLYLGKSIGRDI